MILMKKDDNIPGEQFLKKNGLNEVEQFFFETLNKLFCAKAHLIERLLEIIEDTRFSNLKAAIAETIAETEDQVENLNEIYTLLEKSHSFKNCSALITILDNSFTEIQQTTRGSEIRDLLIMAYIYTAESTETAALKVLKVIADKLPNAEIKKLLILSIAASKRDSALILSLTKQKAA